MEQSTIAIIILFSALILYGIPRIPLSVTTILAMIAMAMTGVITYAQAYSGFANSAVMLVAGMMVIGQALFTTGIAQGIGRLLFKAVGTNERMFIVVILFVGGGLAVFLNGALVVALLMPIINTIIVQSNGAITAKQTYFPLGVASVIGNNLTTISATSMITAAGLVAAAGYGEMSLFAPTMVNLPAFIAVILLYAVFGYKLQKKWFDFAEIPVVVKEDKEAGKVYPKWKQYVTATVLVSVVVALIAGVNYGAAALLGSAILVLTGCIDEKTAFRAVSWSTVIIVAGAIGFSKGLEASGAGEVISTFIINVCGPIGQSPFGMCVIMFLLGSLISNVMSDNASVAILVPIALVVSTKLGTDAMPLVLATASGIKVAIATPISVAPMTMVQVAGYRFKDYAKVGGLINLISLLVTCSILYVIYYM